jgi:hypothetical protein
MTAEYNRIIEQLIDVRIRLDEIGADQRLHHDTLKEQSLQLTNLTTAQERMALILEKMLDRLDSHDQRIAQIEQRLDLGLPSNGKH